MSPNAVNAGACFGKSGLAQMKGCRLKPSTSQEVKRCGLVSFHYCCRKGQSAEVDQGLCGLNRQKVIQEAGTTTVSEWLCLCLGLGEATTFPAI